MSSLVRRCRPTHQDRRIATFAERCPKSNATRLGHHARIDCSPDTVAGFLLLEERKKESISGLRAGRRKPSLSTNSKAVHELRPQSLRHIHGVFFLLQQSQSSAYASVRSWHARFEAVLRKWKLG